MIGRMAGEGAVERRWGMKIVCSYCREESGTESVEEKAPLADPTITYGL